MATDEVFDVAVMAQGRLSADAVREVAAILGKDPYGTRLLLAGKIPKIVAQCQSAASAETLARSLRGLGLLTVVCPDSELHRPPSAIFIAHAFKPGEAEIVFRDRSGAAKTLKSQDVSLIIEGVLSPVVEKEPPREERKLNLPATLLLGGIPVWRRAKESPRNPPAQGEPFVRLYERDSAEPLLEIRRHDFDYSSLGEKMGLSSTANFNTLVGELRRIFPQAVFDRNMMEPSQANVSFAAPLDSVEINCRLIYLFHRAA